MTDPIIFDNSREMLGKLIELHPKGVKFLCPVCHSELDVVLSWDEARSVGKHPGIYCPSQQPSHVYRMFNIPRDPPLPGDAM